mmetsp:Transcript_22785/g.31247  ORF Transcript_22785/g.31247 Transcript_22785/m.31247 type:complete len:1006 (+) Transcript_22785:85-3102(+)
MLHIDVSVCDGYFADSSIFRKDLQLPNTSAGKLGTRQNDVANGLIDGLEYENEKKPSIVTFPIARIEKIGHGSSSTVFKSVMLRTLTVCAEKVVTVDDPSKRSQLRRELEYLKVSFSEDNQCIESTAQSPFIVHLLDVLSNPLDGTLSICLEYMDGGSLQDIVRAGGCADDSKLALIAFQMTSGLKHLHDLRVIHRDLKPSNALITAAGRVKLADFGLARTLEQDKSMADSFVGTFDFMSPERLTGEGYSLISDVWSLGVTLYTVSEGKHPYGNRKGYWELVHATQEMDIPRPNSAIFSDSCGDFMSQACTRDHRLRPSSEMLLQHVWVSHFDLAKVCTATTESTSATYRPAAAKNTSNTSRNTSSRKPTSNGQLSARGLSSNSRNCASILSTAAVASGDMLRAQPKQVSTASNIKAASTQPALPSLTHTKPSVPSIPISIIGFERQASTAAITVADIRKLVRFWKAYVLQLRRFNSTTPSVLKSSRSAATPRSLGVPRYRTPRGAGRGAALPHASGASTARNAPVTANTTAAGAMDIELEDTVMAGLADSLRCDPQQLRDAFLAAIADIKREFSQQQQQEQQQQASTAPDAAVLTARKNPTLSESRKLRRFTTEAATNSAAESAVNLPALSTGREGMLEEKTSNSNHHLSRNNSKGATKRRSRAKALLPSEAQASPPPLQLSQPAELLSKQRQSYRYSCVDINQSRYSKANSGSYSDDDAVSSSRWRQRASSIVLHAAANSNTNDSTLTGSVRPAASAFGSLHKPLEEVSNEQQQPSALKPLSFHDALPDCIDPLKFGFPGRDYSSDTALHWTETRQMSPRSPRSSSKLSLFDLTGEGAQASSHIESNSDFLLCDVDLIHMMSAHTLQSARNPGENTFGNNSNAFTSRSRFNSKCNLMVGSDEGDNSPPAVMVDSAEDSTLQPISPDLFSSDGDVSEFHAYSSFSDSEGLEDGHQLPRSTRATNSHIMLPDTVQNTRRGKPIQNSIDDDDIEYDESFEMDDDDD